MKKGKMTFHKFTRIMDAIDRKINENPENKAYSDLHSQMLQKDRKNYEKELKTAFKKK